MTDLSTERRKGLTFREWKREVNKELVHLCGMVADDLPDYDYWDAWDGEVTPADTAREVLEEAGYDGFID